MWNALITDSLVIASLSAREAWDNYVSAMNDMITVMRSEAQNPYAKYVYGEIAKQSMYVHFERVEDEVGKQ